MGHGQDWAVSWFGVWNHGGTEVAPEQGPYWVHNATVNYRVLGSVDLHLTANNLLDEEYLSPSDPGQLNRGVINRGRSVTAGLTVRF